VGLERITLADHGPVMSPSATRRLPR
jgi:hypothetical protein